MAAPIPSPFVLAKFRRQQEIEIGGPTRREVLSTAVAESHKCAGRMRGFPRQKNRWLTNTRRAECARRSSASFPRCVGPAHDLVVPGRVIALSEVQSDVAVNYGPECTTLCEHAHVNVNQEVCNRKQRSDRMQEHRNIAQPAEIPRDPFRKPQYNSSQQQYDRGIEKTPKQSFLSRVVASCRRHLVVFVLNIVTYRSPPLLVHFRALHLRRPVTVHTRYRVEENQTDPGMQCSRNLPATHQHGDPKKPR